MLYLVPRVCGTYPSEISHHRHCPIQSLHLWDQGINTHSQNAYSSALWLSSELRTFWDFGSNCTTLIVPCFHCGWLPRYNGSWKHVVSALYIVKGSNDAK